jgi:hypothetical protein
MCDVARVEGSPCDAARVKAGERFAGRLTWEFLTVAGLTPCGYGQNGHLTHWSGSARLDKSRSRAIRDGISVSSRICVRF